MSRSDIFDKLRDKDWHGEQINYAYRKYKGLRTGMFEIPIFKFLENREVKQQLAFRDQRSPDNSTVPKPNMPFIKPNSFNSFRPNNSVQLGKINRPITPRDVQKSVFANPARIMSTPKQSPQFIKPQQQVPAKINPAAAQPSSPSSSALASPNNLPPKNPGYKQFGEQMYQKKVEEKKIEPENKDKITDNKK